MVSLGMVYWKVKSNRGKCHVAITGSYMGLDLIEDDGYFEIEH